MYEFLSFQVIERTTSYDGTQHWHKTENILYLPLKQIENCIITKIEDLEFKNLYSIEVLGFGVKLKNYCLDTNGSFDKNIGVR